MATSDPAAVRSSLVDALRLDLVGPEPDSPHASEILETAPSLWYLTGLLVPFEAPLEQRHDETEQLDLIGNPRGAGLG